MNICFLFRTIIPDLTHPAIKTRPMARKPNQGGNVWPSFELASRLYDLANIAFIVSLIVGVIATVLLVWMGNVKEGFLRRDVAQAGAPAAHANERAAALEKEAANARLETENLRSQLVPRRLKRDAFVKALVDVPKAAVEIIYARDDFEVIAHVPAIGIAGIWRRGAGLTAESRADSSCE
jgi:hypothetical protein